MWWCRSVFLILAVLCLQTSAWAVNQGRGQNKTVLIYQQEIRRNYHNTSRYLIPSRAIVIEGNADHIMRISNWLDQIARVPHGRETLHAILSSGNQLTIRHSPWALLASGRTLAPMSEDLTNGRGEDIVILFDVRIPDHGSHRVFDAAGEPLEFTALQNLFHELVHARHQTNGSWHYWDSEGQAIAEENIFRAQRHTAGDSEVLAHRAGVEGEQFWWPASMPVNKDF